MAAMRRALQLLLLLAAALGQGPRPGDAFGLGDVADVLHVGRQLVQSVFSAWHLVDEATASDGHAPALFHKNERRLLGHIQQVGAQTASMEARLGAAAAAGARALQRLRGVLRVDAAVRELERDCADLAEQHATLQRYVRRGWDNATAAWTLERHTLEDMAVHAVSHGHTSARAALARLARRMTGPFPRDLTDAYTKETESLQCSVNQSPQQVLYNLYNAVALSELKGYAMMQFSWMLLRLYNKGNFTQEAALLRDTFEERTRREVAAVRAAMAVAGRTLWRCDPAVHQEGETFVQLTRLLQGHLQNEVDMNRDATCRENCNYYSYAESTGCYDKRTCDVMHRCNGRLLDCRYVDSDMWVCQADKLQTRRYEWIEYENGRTLGRPGTCPRRRFKVDSWWRWLFWHCSYCFCLCDEHGPRSDRYFNLRPVVADTANNMIVTGLRFVKENRVVHLQIQEGALLARGAVNESSLRWRPVDDYRVSDADVQNGRDYHTLSYEQRAIDLDDLEAPPGFVLTGVRFRNVGAHLNLEINVTPLNFSAGTLVKPHEKSMWISNDNTDAAIDGPRKELKLLAPDVPTNSHAGSSPDSQSDQFLLFTHSDVDRDAAQTTVPFVDAQPVAPRPAVPLAGAGVYHKGTPTYGGFVAPRVLTYDFGPHLVVGDAPLLPAAAAAPTAK